MNESILAHLGGRMTKEQERLATEGLAYLLVRSTACAEVVRQLASRAGCMLPEPIRYRAEVSGDNLARPDVVGTDAQNDEVIVIEGKFDAGLTDNQPNAYLSRLGSLKPGIVIFVVPELRVPRLWRKVAERVGIAADAPLEGGTRHSALDTSRTMLMLSWRELLDRMLQAARFAEDPVVADVQQLQSLCARFEGEAFLPFAADELSSIRLPRRHRDLCDLVDAIVTQLVDAGHASLDGLRATPQRSGYYRYLWLGCEKPGGGATIGLMYDLWQTHESSPIWLAPERPTSRFSVRS